ncbi:hypothetical protein BJX68DRAFT_263029 [Aspergillus pseudodeflectus]|uniref:Fucose-specific lectin n=1 Tax=Aspergillus pseudodeflectus TaxID=176178 RepID=A0ABR4KYW4_9EURO
MYYVIHEDGDLIEKHWNGHQVTDKVFIATGVTESFSAKYLLNEDTRRLFFQDAHDQLQCSDYDEEEEEWIETALTMETHLAMHPKSQISGCFEASDQLIYFQAPSGRLQGVRIGGPGEYSALPDFPDLNAPSPLVHTAYEASNGTIHLLYINKANVVRGLQLSSSGWHDSAVKRASFGDHRVQRFTVVPTDGGAVGLLAVSAGNKVLYIDEHGNLIELGQISQNRFHAITSKECATEIVRLGLKIIRAAGGSQDKDKDKGKK